MKRCVAILTLCLFAMPAHSESPEIALFSQSVQAWERAAQIDDPADRIVALQAAQSAINAILEAHASSDIAARIALEQSDLPFTRADLTVAIAVAQGEIEAARPAREVNAIIVSVIGLLEAAEGIVPHDRTSAMQAYLMLREADASVARAKRDFPLAENLALLEHNKSVRSRDKKIAEAAGRVSGFCDNLTPQNCLFAEAERLTEGIEGGVEKTWPLATIAQARADAGQPDDAVRL